MSKKIIKNNSGILRLIDANANRTKEGLRVLEDIARFIADDKKLTSSLKKIRHEITNCLRENSNVSIFSTLKHRHARRDVGKKTMFSEKKRENICDIFMANSQRVKESIRVLEEFFKLFDTKTSARFKTLRYKVYDLEKEAIEKNSKLCNNTTDC